MTEPLAFPVVLPGLASFDQILTIIFLILVIMFMVHSAIVSYHWITYAQNRAHAFTATVLHIGVGAFLLIAMGGIIIF